VGFHHNILNVDESKDLFICSFWEYHDIIIHTIAACRSYRLLGFCKVWHHPKKFLSVYMTCLTMKRG
jgi:hypothetical protein